MRTPAEIKKLPMKEWTPEDFETLEREWIINWVWNNVLPTWMRYIMSQLFFYLDFKKHDGNYWLIEDMPFKEREKARKEADFWLLKYSWVSPIEVIKKYERSPYIIKNILNLLLTSIMFLLLLIPCVFVAIPAYIAVRIWGSKSFDNK